MMELAAQDARPVPREVSRKQGQSKGPGASAKPAEVVLTTRAVTHQRKCWSEAGFSGTWYRSSLPLVVDDDPTDSRWMFLHLKKLHSGPAKWLHGKKFLPPSLMNSNLEPTW